MQITKIAKMKSGVQDGAIFGKYLFRFDVAGNCGVYGMESIDTADGGEVMPIAEFRLDRADLIAPHSNSVVFGAEYFAEGDEFPLLYTNIYNNYAAAADKLIGVSCVYRITRSGEKFESALVGLIEIGFTSERGLWRSSGETEDARPYGNFVIDRERGIYYAFVMRDSERSTRYFSFELPRLTDGIFDERFGVKRVTLSAAEIKDYFDTPYHHFIQGACFFDGKIYSVEGFGEKIHPAIRVIDTVERRQVFYLDFFEAGAPFESEFIDFHDGRCYYGDHYGNLYALDF